MMLSIFSCACWPFVYHFWRNFSTRTLPIFKLGYLSFCCWIVSVHCIFCILDPYEIYDLHILLLFCRLSFHFLDNGLWYTKAFNFDEVQFICFFLLFMLLVSWSFFYDRDLMLSRKTRPFPEDNLYFKIQSLANTDVTAPLESMEE